MELYNTEFADAYKLFYDNESEYSAGCQCYVHDVHIDMIENELSKRRVFHIGEEHFFKKSDYPNGLPTAKKE
jgi:deoxyadenosine/deoxycytidine kinase